MEKQLEWLKEITEVAGVSGFEGRVKEVLKNRLSKIAEVSGDKLGSVIFRHGGQAKGPKVMVAAHMDEIGFIVKSITKDGYLKFITIGGWWEQVMLAQRVTVHTAKGDICGVIGCKPPHLLQPEERKKMVEKKDMYIDIGAVDDKDAKENFGVRPGDAVSPVSPFTVMKNEKMLMAKAWDNRGGCAVMADVLEKLAEEGHPNEVYAVGTVQEEVGLRGAQTSAAVINPDVAFAIDVCTAGDTPGIQEDQAPTKLGKGVAVAVFDAGLIPHKGLRDFVIQVAEENNIPYQLDFMEGGSTDAARIQQNFHGVPSIYIGIPTRYIHSHQSIIHRDDYDAAVRLLSLVIQRLDQQAYQNIVG